MLDSPLTKNMGEKLFLTIFLVMITGISLFLEKVSRSSVLESNEERIRRTL